MHNVEVFISNGREEDRYRDIGVDVLSRLQHLLRYELGYDVAIGNWDYRHAPPTVVAAGGLAATSLRMVDRSQCLVAIFGRRMPPITTAEVRQAFELRQSHSEIDVFVFANPDRVTDRYHAFVREISDTYGEQIQWAPYADPLSFQAILYITLTKFLLERLATGIPAFLTRGAT